MTRLELENNVLKAKINIESKYKHKDLEDNETRYLAKIQELENIINASKQESNSILQDYQTKLQTMLEHIEESDKKKLRQKREKNKLKLNYKKLRPRKERLN